MGGREGGRKKKGGVRERIRSETRGGRKKAKHGQVLATYIHMVVY